jgi:hypothetical protein
MENVCHPMCACGLPVIMHESWSACYDDGGSVDSFEVDIEYDVVCEICYIRAPHMSTYERPTRDIKPTKDELPF